MKKTVQLLSVFLMLAVVITSCKSGGGSPTDVVKSFFEALAKKDFDGAAKLATKDSKSTIDMFKKGMDMAEKMDTTGGKKDPMDELKNLVYGKERISGDSAFVSMSSKDTEQKGPSEIALVKEDGKWKVDFSMSSLMKMGTNRMQEESMKTPQVTPEEMENAAKAADSILKNTDPEKLKELQNEVQQKVQEELEKAKRP